MSSKRSTPLLVAIASLLLVGNLGGVAQGAAAYHPCKLTMAGLQEVPPECVGAPVPGDPIRDAVEGAPEDEFIDVATSIVYQQTEAGLEPIGASLPSLGYLQVVTCMANADHLLVLSNDCDSTSPATALLLQASRPPCLTESPWYGPPLWLNYFIYEAQYEVFHKIDVATTGCDEIEVVSVRSFAGPSQARTYPAPDCHAASSVEAQFPVWHALRLGLKHLLCGTLFSECPPVPGLDEAAPPLGPCDLDQAVCSVESPVTVSNVGPTRVDETFYDGGFCYWWSPQTNHYQQMPGEGYVKVPERLTTTLFVNGAQVGQPSKVQIC